MNDLSENMNHIYNLDLETLHKYLISSNIDIVPEHVEVMKYILTKNVLCHVLWSTYKGLIQDYDNNPNLADHVKNMIAVIDSDFKQSELKENLKDVIYISCEELIRNYKLKELLG